MSTFTLEEAETIAKTYERVISRVEHGDYRLFNYAYMDWPMFRDEPRSRELRGIVFDIRDGSIVSRPFEKVFNVNENEETQEPDLHFSGVKYEKLDGAMAQVTVHGDDLVVGSRHSLQGAVTTNVTDYLTRHPEVEDFIRRRPDLTFLFEYIDPKYPIVIRSPRERLVFLNARDKETGEYRYDEVLGQGLPPFEFAEGSPLLPKGWPVIKEWLASPEATGFEGYVFWLDRHQRFVKVKTAWYREVHRLVGDQCTPPYWMSYWVEDTLDDYVATLQQNGLGDRLTDDINLTLMAFLTPVERRLHDLLDAIEGAETRKDVALALNEVTTGSRLDRLLFAATMRSFSEGKALTYHNVFTTWKKNLAAAHNTVNAIKEILADEGIYP